MSLKETLLSDSTIWLFGRPMADIQLNPNRDEAYEIEDPTRTLEPGGGAADSSAANPSGQAAAPTASATSSKSDEDVPEELKRRSRNHFVADLLLAKDARLARIYAFSFQNEFFPLVSPALFVVNGPGGEARGLSLSSAGMRSTTARILGGDVGATGLSDMLGTFADDMRVWVYDRDDFAVRLDMMTGPLERVLIEYELGDPGLQGFAPRGGHQLGRPGPLGGRPHGRRGRRWRADDE